MAFSGQKVRLLTLYATPSNEGVGKKRQVKSGRVSACDGGQKETDPEYTKTDKDSRPQDKTKRRKCGRLHGAANTGLHTEHKNPRKPKTKRQIQGTKR